MILNTNNYPMIPQGWPYGIPLDPKYLYRAYSKNDIAGYDSFNSSKIIEPVIPGDDLAPVSGFEGTDLTDLLSQRGLLIDSRVDMILADIDQRRRIKDSNIYRINLDQCAHRNTIFSRGEDLWDKNRLKLEENILSLEEEKRKEESSYFRDILFLKKELRDFVIEKMEEGQKASLLSN